MIILLLQGVIIYKNNYIQYTANTFKNFIPNFQKNNSSIINNIPNNLELQIKQLKDELNKEKDKNKILENENKKLNDIINNMKNENNDLNNQIKTLEMQLNKLKLELQDYKSNININNTIINKNDLIMPMLPGENVWSIIFNSQGIQNICNWSLPCKNTNLFVRLEEILNNKFPELKKHEAYYMVNTRRIRRFQTLEENGIKDNDMINIFLIDC